MKERFLLQSAAREFQRLKRLGEGGLTQLDDAQLFRMDQTEGNSSAILMKHLSGNMLSRWRDFMTTDGEKPDRDRDSEFVINEADTREALLARWERGWECLFNALAPLSDEDLTRIVHIRGEPHTVLEAIHRQLSHYAYHIGQIVLLAKSIRGRDFKPLSIARGESEKFNQAPTNYLEDE